MPAQAAQRRLAVLRGNSDVDHLPPRGPPRQPDASVVRADDGTYKVIVDDSRTPTLRISRYYRERLQSGNITPEEREYIKRKITAAQWLIESIEQRRNTLTRVSQAIVDHQTSFLDDGPEHI